MAAENVQPCLEEMDRALSEARADLAATQAEAERLREVLMPFARVADAFNDDVTLRHFGDDEQFYHRETRHAISILTFGDLRRARAALAQGGRDDG